MMRPRFSLTVLSLLAFISAATAAEVSVPQLIGLPKVEALSLLNTLGLSAEVAINNNCGPKERVSLQQPPAGTAVASGAVIILWINNDAGVAVPSLVGKTLEEATARLAAIGLKASARERHVEVNPNGFCIMGYDDLGVKPEIVETMPSEGTFICPQSEVEVIRIHEYFVKYAKLGPHELCP